MNNKRISIHLLPPCPSAKCTIYGFGISWGGTTLEVSGYPSKSSAKIACYTAAIKAGWLPPKLRTYWFQFWRPREWSEEIKEAYKDAV